MADTFRSRFQQTVNRLLTPLGVQLIRSSRSFDMMGLLSRARARGFAPETIVDVGASNGIWSLRARRQFPAAQFLLFEPLTERQASLQKLHRQYGFHVVSAVAGATAGNVAFAIDPALDGSGVASSDADGTRLVPQDTIDHAVSERRLRGPFCLKLDTHGYEVSVLNGAAAVLAQTELVVIEAYNFTPQPGCLRFHELCAWMEERGLRCCDVADPMRRPGDGAFWQLDLAFAPASSPLFASNRYK